MHTEHTKMEQYVCLKNIPVGFFVGVLLGLFVDFFDGWIEGFVLGFVVGLAVIRKKGGQTTQH